MNTTLKSWCSGVKTQWVLTLSKKEEETEQVLTKSYTRLPLRPMSKVTCIHMQMRPAWACIISLPLKEASILVN